MAQGNPYKAYETTNVGTADQRHLILMLYDGAIRFMKKSVGKIEARDFEASHNYLVRSREIVSELLSTLKAEKAGEVGQNLKRLYVYMYNRLVEANLMKDPAMVEEVIRIMSTLRDGWANIKPETRRINNAPEANRKVNLTM